MNEKRSQTLKDYIGDLYPQIQELPMRVEKKTAAMFNFNPRYTLDVLYGPDIESELFENQTDLENGEASLMIPCEESGYDKRAMKLAEDVRLDAEGILFTRGKVDSDFDDYDYDFDDDVIEFRLAPRNPTEIIDSYETVQGAYNAKAAANNLVPDFAVTEHWHMSLNQNQRGLFAKRKTQKPINCVAILSLLKIQQEALPFLIQPRRLEDRDFAGQFLTKDIAFHGFAGASFYTTLRASKPASGVHTLEPRLGVGCHQSVALYSSAVHWGIQSYGQYDIRNIENTYAKGRSQKFAGITAFPDFSAIKFPEGKAAFLNELEKTTRSRVVQEMLPTNVFNALVLDAVDRYQAFLKTKPAQRLYDEAEIGELNQRCDDMKENHFDL